MTRSTRRNRLAASRRQLTKLLIIAALIEHELPIGYIDVGEVNKDEIEEAADLARHGSLHVPKVFMNAKRLDHFERYVPAWSRVSIETRVLEVIAEFENGEIIVGLPPQAEKRCIIVPSTVEKEFRELRRLPPDAAEA